MSNDYQPNEIETKWREFWQKHKTFQVDLDKAKKPYYNLMMFPYPSAEGLHVGNMYAFTGSDIWGRYMQMKGFAVFEPIGLDGFGIHSENYAIKVGKHPAEQAKISEANFYRQLKSIGNMFSWDNKLETYDPDYYKWTQWIFVQLFKAGLAYRAKAKVNWCPSCKTVLADEQVIDGLCERCSNKVEDRDLEQWFFKITDYADRLLENTKKIDWSEKVLTAQRNWIGKSEGIQLEFRIENSQIKINVFTTAIDTIYGATFMVLSPKHPLLHKMKIPKKYQQEVNDYIEQAKNKAAKSNGQDLLEKTGIFTGLYAINPVNNREVSIWISDYVLMEYGTGAIMGVPGHDTRDYDFAKKYQLPIIPVIKPSTQALTTAKVKQDGFWDYEEIKTKYASKSELFNSDYLTGLSSQIAKKQLNQDLSKKGIGKLKSHYHLRDWLISRQRYWGPPIPMINCPKCGWQPVPEKDLPVLLPYVKDWRPKGTGRGPLAQLKDWVKTTCPKCDDPAERETDVSDTFLDSAWYFLRYSSLKVQPSKERLNLSEKIPWNRKVTGQWLPVNMYIGGAEHSVLHLLYSRFLTMVFKDLKLLDFEEPFTKFRCHGLIIKDSAKMSKSKGNIVNPDKYIAKCGADALRCYLMFLGPLADGGDFRDTGMVGMYKFLSRVYRLVQENLKTPACAEASAGRQNSKLNQLSTINNQQLQNFWIHKTIKRVTEGIERLKYNTSLAAIMEFVNYLSAKCKPSSRAQVERVQNAKLSLDSIKTLILLLAPFAPHLTEELWQTCKDRVFTSKITGGKSYVKTGSLHPFGSIHHQPWPTYNPKFLKEKTAIIVVQVNGKVRDRVEVDSVLANFSSRQDKEKVLDLIKNSPKLQTVLKNQPIKKTIFVKGKLINLVI